MEKARRRQIPAFGEWNYSCGEILPITQYFDSAMQAGLGRGQHYQEGDKVCFMPLPPPQKPSKQAWKEATAEKQLKGKHDRKQSRVSDAAAHTPRKVRVGKAVDEDLYKIPPDLLSPKQRRKSSIRKLWMWCASRLNCIA